MALKFRFDFYHHLVDENEIMTQLKSLTDAVVVLTQEVRNMTPQMQTVIDELVVEVSNMGNKVDSAVAVIGRFADLFDEAEEMDAVRAVTAAMRDQAARLGTAIDTVPPETPPAPPPA